MTYRLCLLVACGILTACGSCFAAERSGSPVSVSAVAALTFPDQPVKFAMLEARTQAFSHVAIAAAIAYLEGSAGYDDFQLRVAATLAFEMGGWTVENRHLIAMSPQSMERYRNRVRLIRPGLLGQQSLSVRAFDELFVDLDRGRYLRNNLALGFGVQIRSALSAELYHVWVDNHGTTDDTYLLAVVALRL